ncbi:uncharacterized protein LOC120780096 [Bactrocera tryoni]|uniref:uncharacterized protein LOC120780096 n=1 Tax=Bactrocera tryoni TaxID=59916 RepID=UPI001A962742|nr:uncharacterized protein LOC120780096 [Bactrocera tryoni]
MPNKEIRNGKGRDKLKPSIRFKQLARSALINQQWLSDLIDHQRTKIPLYRPKVTGILTNNKLRARLAPYAYFIILGPKRKIIEQGREPATVYFVLTGDITVTTKIWNSVKNKYIERVEYLSGPGEWLGEIDFLENQKRRQTFTSKCK